MLDIKNHDIWTDKFSGNDYAVIHVGYHVEHSEYTVSYVGADGKILCMSYERFVEDHELTHRVYKDIE